MSKRPSWFRKLTGVDEISTSHVYERFQYENGVLRNDLGKSWKVGRLSMPTLESLRSTPYPKGTPRLSVKFGDVREIISNPNSQNQTFQVASQFNLLEMADPHVTPESGISNYEFDHTQGPVCAMAAGPGTIYRQYFCFSGSPHGQGQTSDHQIDCLRGVEELLMREMNCTNLWTMKNGYALFSPDQARAVRLHLEGLGEDELDQIRQCLQVGVMSDTQVTTDPSTKHTITQVYGSALPISYCEAEGNELELLARLVLDASYEASLWACLAEGKQPAVCYWTLLGGGAFGNDLDWIVAAMERALAKLHDADIQVVLNLYQPVYHQGLEQFLAKYQK